MHLGIDEKHSSHCVLVPSFEVADVLLAHSYQIFDFPPNMIWTYIIPPLKINKITAFEISSKAK